MFLTFEDRASESPFVERIWTARSERAGEFLSLVAGHWEMVVTRRRDRAFLTVRGPETRATPADCPADGDWVAVRFKLGTFWPACLPGTLRDRRDVTLPGASTRSFWAVWIRSGDRRRVRDLQRRVEAGRDRLGEAIHGAAPGVLERVARRDRSARADRAVAWCGCAPWLT